MKKEIISCYINSLTNINGVQLCFGNLKNEKTLHLAPKTAIPSNTLAHDMPLQPTPGQF